MPTRPCRAIGVCLFLALVLCGFTSVAAQQESPASLQPWAREQLVALAHLYGTLRWFHPSDGCADADWNAIAIQGVREALASNVGFADRLEMLIAPIAPTVRVFPVDEPEEIPPALRRPVSSGPLQTVAWEHIGLGTSLYAQYGSAPYQSRRIRSRVPSDETLPPEGDPADVSQTRLNDELSAWIPTVLYADGGGTLPHAIAPASSEPPTDVDEQTMMLADAIVIWNVMEHFFPYFGVIDVDWDAQLELALSHILALGSGYARADLKADLIVPLVDGHAGIYDAQERASQMFPELGVGWIEEQLVVTAVGSDAADVGIAIGDRIVAIDGQSADEAMDSVRARFSGSDQYRTVKGWMNVLVGDSGTDVALDLMTPSGGPYSASLKRTQQALLAEARPNVVCEPAPSIAYVDITRITEDELEDALSGLSGASAIIIDARGYPAIPSWSSFFIRRALSAMVTKTPIYRLPDQEDVEYRVQRTSSTPAGTWMKSAVPELVFLIDARAVSAAEHQLSVFKCAGIGTFVGSPTAGANGNINLLELPSGVGVTWAGMIAEWPDGSLFHGVGIEPDIVVKPTIQGIIDGHDELLNAALDYLRG